MWLAWEQKIIPRATSGVHGVHVSIIHRPSYVNVLSHRSRCTAEFRGLRPDLTKQKRHVRKLFSSMLLLLQTSTWRLKPKDTNKKLTVRSTYLYVYVRGPIFYWDMETVDPRSWPQGVFFFSHSKSNLVGKTMSKICECASVPVRKGAHILLSHRRHRRDFFLSLEVQYPKKGFQTAK